MDLDFVLAAPQRGNHAMDIYGIAWDFMVRQCFDMGRMGNNPYISWGKLREKSVDSFDVVICVPAPRWTQDFEKIKYYVKNFS